MAQGGASTFFAGALRAAIFHFEYAEPSTHFALRGSTGGMCYGC